MAAGTKTIKIAFDGTAKGLDRATQSAKESLAEVEQASRSAGDGFDRAADGADTAEGRAQGLASTMTGTKDVMSGVGEIARGNLFDGLVMSAQGAADLAEGLNYTVIPTLKSLATGFISTAASTAKSTAANVAHRTATIAQTVAVKAATVAQKALNAVLRANPIGIVITILAALAAAVVVAYKRSETFRRIVHAAFSVVSSAARAVGSAVSTGMAVIRNALSAAASFVSGRVSAIRSFFGSIPGAVRSALSSAASFVQTQLSRIGGFFSALPGRVRGALSALGSAISSPFRSALNGIKRLWNSTVGRVSFSIPSWVPGIGGNGWSFPRMATGGVARSGRAYLVGENGPELFMPGRTGRVTPNDELGGDVQVNVMISRDAIAGIAQIEINKNGRSIKRAVAAGAMRAVAA